MDADPTASIPDGAPTAFHPGSCSLLCRLELWRRMHHLLEWTRCPVCGGNVDYGAAPFTGPHAALYAELFGRLVDTPDSKEALLEFCMYGWLRCKGAQPIEDNMGMGLFEYREQSIKLQSDRPLPHEKLYLLGSLIEYRDAGN